MAITPTQMAQTEAPEQEPTDGSPEQEDQGGTSIELMIKQDGTMSVSIEADDVEANESNETEVKSLDEALKYIRIAAQHVLEGSGTPADVQEEDDAYKQEMASPTM